MSFQKKYAPQTVDELAIANQNTRKRIADYADGLRTGHVLIYGPKGTGKSSAADVIVKSRIGNTLGPIQRAYEGASMTREDVDGLVNVWGFQRLGKGGKPVSVINEIDLLPRQTVEHLKAFMDEQGEVGQIIATTNNPHLLTAPIRDRFDMIELPAIDPKDFELRIRAILEAEGVAV